MEPRSMTELEIAGLKASRDCAWDLFAAADADARAVPYLMDMIAHLQGQIAALTGGDDPAMDIEGHK